MMPLLPAQDTNPAGRAGQLEAERARLRYAWDQPPGIAMAEGVPHGQGYPPGVLAKVAELTAAMAVNRGAARLVEAARSLREGPAEGSLAACRALFATISAPGLADIGPGDPRADALFAWQRVAGANPVLLEGITQVPPHFPVDARAFAASAIDGDTLAAAAAEGRLYLADWRLLEGIPAGVGEGRSKYLSAPMALFVHRAGVGLAPVAIQCGQRPGAATPVLTPRDGVAWQMARVAAQVADCNLQEIYFHLGRAHFLVEAFAMATLRQLAAAHPLTALLSPHFEGTLAINDAARTKLCAPGGQLEELLAPTREASLALSLRALGDFRLEDALLPADLRGRRVDGGGLADYPYRDDGRLIWAAIGAFVAGYVGLYYPDATAVSADPELAAWAAELSSQEGGRLGGFPARIETPAALIDALTFVIFTASAQHAAFNYTQYAFMGYAPNMPAAGYAPPPGGLPGDADPDRAWASVLPSPSLAEGQLEFFYQQSNVRNNRLGAYPRGHFDDPGVAPLLERFTGQLGEAERAIAARDAGRILSYPWLLPSNITASIHI
jgi:arachidonate 15-lipoxygenase